MSNIPPNIIELHVCVPHKKHDCKICNDYLNGPLMQPFKDDVKKHKKNRMSEEELEKQRQKVNDCCKKNYTNIYLADPKEIFSELEELLKKFKRNRDLLYVCGDFVHEWNLIKEKYAGDD